MWPFIPEDTKILWKKAEKNHKINHYASDKDNTRMNGFKPSLTWMWEFSHEWMNE